MDASWDDEVSRTINGVTVTLNLTSDLVSRNCIQSGAYPIFYEIGIPNLVCKCILGLQSVTYHFRVTVTLTLNSDLVIRIIVSGAYL